MSDKTIIIYSRDKKFNHRKGAWKQVGTRTWSHPNDIENSTDEQMEEIRKYMIEQVPDIDNCWTEIVSKQYFETAWCPYY